MLRRHYNNFVRSTSPTKTIASNRISGEEARKLYLEEVGQVQENQVRPSGNANVNAQNVSQIKHTRKPDSLDVSNLKLFTSVQDNDIDSLKHILDACPDKINTVDEYGWNLLMIACQAKSYEAVKELLKRGIDITVQDKAGNSAQSLIIKNKSSYLADILLSHVSSCGQPKKTNVYDVKEIKHKKRHKELFICEICDGKTFDSKDEHLSSTIHNIKASKGRKIPTNYVIPQSNKGYQIMLKTGWNKEIGLGPDGSGKKYPIKAVQKNDKKGLGHEQKRLKSSNGESTKQQIKKHEKNVNEKNRRFEINFRREFY
ncbi:G patch domain and ankyrin repeat-containing protein 1 homolog [Maniola jurtina]|uniref:G patch domain and ankyrin repeat-containing protein 1 homolog n=1 Tax=Maniola jurtina TaxID=191418 RepID=UPI001E68BFA7|nr:G patch domain and ankyrin repeat-containing protein 1 homolog [Maniola jurtina]XP_045774404.1 G patch domain and ankyrin repeat-containing protein 1 homolog [Maniola jurtina]